jgi:hypothetical protein
MDEVSPMIAKRDNGRLALFDNSMANIVFTPGSKASHDPAGTLSIPATWEIDWARPYPHCLPTRDALDKAGWTPTDPAPATPTAASTGGPTGNVPQK